MKNRKCSMFGVCVLISVHSAPHSDCLCSHAPLTLLPPKSPAIPRDTLNRLYMACSHCRHCHSLSLSVSYFRLCFLNVGNSLLFHLQPSFLPPNSSETISIHSKHHYLSPKYIWTLPPLLSSNCHCLRLGPQTRTSGLLQKILASEIYLHVAA